MTTQTKPMITDIFVAGARKGWNIATTSTVPNILMAFVIIKVLKISGALDLMAGVFEPVMALFGLPGEAAAVLLGGWMSMGGGVGVAVSLFTDGILTGEHLAILAPAIYLMGSQVQYAGRILGVIGTRAKLIPVMIGISLTA
jgi:spore maturation protein SpmB